VDETLFTVCYRKEVLWLPLRLLPMNLDIQVVIVVVTSFFTDRGQSLYKDQAGRVGS
jgi:hypothetical protein